MLIGVTVAASVAFTISRGVGRNFADKVVSAEMSEQSTSESNAMRQKLDQVTETIRNGTTVQQLTALILLRLTPVVPFSASNYVLGMTPVRFPVFFGATVLGMIVWSVLFASIGAAGRVLLENGEDIGSVLAAVGE